MDLNESKSWHSELEGWSDDILPRYEEWAAKLPEGAILVEVGTYRGRSLRYMAEKIHRLGKSVKIYGIDTSEIPENWQVLLRNILAAPLEEQHLIHLIRAPSVMASRMFDDRLIDWVFIDALHTVEAVREDCLSWLPKIKKGGLLGGHD